VFRKAKEENRVIVTFDLDFGEIAARSRQSRSGAIH
jgi:predicted nuclease of predicted toxin-antitoxin system